MKNFKLGDRVRITSTWSTFYNDVGRILDSDDIYGTGMYAVELETKFQKNSTVRFFECELEKLGDNNEDNRN